MLTKIGMEGESSRGALLVGARDASNLGAREIKSDQIESHFNKQRRLLLNLEQALNGVEAGSNLDLSDESVQDPEFSLGRAKMGPHHPLQLLQAPKRPVRQMVLQV
ncbi:hypothetical protein GCM10007079_04220 [Nocardiopsis terrae]|nr:hypothetical protein GCM10007079_04220 [Nocardiopsis terrae]